MRNKEFLNIIKTNIDNDGYHITFVNGGQNPDFSYSIGLTEKVGFELIIAGGGNSIKENESIFKNIYQQLQFGSTNDSQLLLFDNDVYRLINVDPSWNKKLMLGVFDYYGTDEIIAFQIIPLHKTIDTPLMSKARILNDPIWKWLDMEWDIGAPKNSYVITDIYSLRGKTITELSRWEDHVWEMFSGPGPDVVEEEIKIVPLGTILGIDDTLQPILNLLVGEGLWRDSKDSSWQNW